MHDLEQQDIKPSVLKLLVIIVEWNKIKKVKKVLQEELVHFQFVCAGEGTASSELLDVLGIGEIDKGILFSLQPEFRIPELIKNVSEKLELDRSGNGIAFTVPLSGVCNPVPQILSEEHLKIATVAAQEKKEHIFEFHKQVDKKLEEQRKMEAMKGIPHDLIIALINQGYSEDLMDSAKKAGAGGGTVIHARRIGMEDSVKFFGISVQAEKEIVVILAPRNIKNDIMKAINQSVGLATQAHGIIFSLPVDNIAGLDFNE